MIYLESKLGRQISSSGLSLPLSTLNSQRNVNLLRFSAVSVITC